MRRHASLSAFSLLVTVILPVVAVGEADFLDIRASSPKPVGQVSEGWGKGAHPPQWADGGATLVMKEGESVTLVCRWRIDLVDPASYWIMRKPWGNEWPGRLEDNGAAAEGFLVAIHVRHGAGA